ncbi:MAG: Asp-tRNA(Asn)/Glu-tRNA(Gln) amidotransferase subunit GatB [Spirochaetes bacterium]|nr:Asp-tRNA(Asn)/Glu-tRNA(Gln) amidotransferase subunit GatB [Spirochaetota bacterium]
MKKHIDVDNLIELSSFSVTSQEREKIESEIEDFLEYADIISQAECDELLSASPLSETFFVIRADQNFSWTEKSALFKNAPVMEKSSYLVPPQANRIGKEKEIKSDVSTVSIGDKYEVVIGLEVHAQLKTKTKLFCSCSTEFGKKPNDNTCPVCSGQPGVLPVINQKVIEMAIMAGLAMNCKINDRSVFARKNYFYPDLPKGYQISQFDEPVCTGGFIEIETPQGLKAVQLNRIHIEEDAGKMVHVGAPGIWGSKASAVDFNRSSVPLLEIVSEPNLSSAKEAKEYVMMLRSILVNLRICDGNLEEGSLRCDANISLRQKGETKLGVKTEVKNMNSFKAIEKAINFEIDRQKKLIKQGLPIEQETRLWDESSQKTYTMRSKEDSHDYRYFPDPDLRPLIIDQQQIDTIRTKLPQSPLKKKQIFLAKYQINQDQVNLLIQNPDYADFLEEVSDKLANTKLLSNWFFNELLAYLTEKKQNHLLPDDFAEFLIKIDQGMITGKMGKKILNLSFQTKKPLDTVVKEQGFQQITDQSTIKNLINEVLAENSEQIKQYFAGKEQLFGFFIGQVMKKSQGQANPGLVNQILSDSLKGLKGA